MSARSTGRRVFSALTVVLFVATGYTAFANVLSDDTALRARTLQLAQDKAGCASPAADPLRGPRECRLVQMNGNRGMISEDISYTFDGAGMVNVSCKRPYIAFGEYACEATKAP